MHLIITMFLLLVKLLDPHYQTSTNKLPLLISNKDGEDKIENIAAVKPGIVARAHFYRADYEAANLGAINHVKADHCSKLLFRL